MDVSVDDVQFYISRGLTPLPFLYHKYLNDLKNKSAKHSVSLLPITVLEMYNMHIVDKINKRIVKLPPHIQKKYANIY